MTKSVVVTGVSSGIGRAIAAKLIAQGHTVFGSVRTQADAARAQQEFGGHFKPLLMDTTDEDAVHAQARAVRRALNGVTLNGLVNNAGFCVVGPLLHQPIADMRRQIETNTLGPAIVSQAFAPLLGADRSLAGTPGRIINISSVGGRFAAPFLGAYAASKHALEGMSEALRRELLMYGIDVILIEPGYVNTPTLDKAQAEDYGQYQDTDYASAMARFRTGFIAEGRKGLHPDVIGDTVWTALTSARPKVCYTVMKGTFKNWTVPMALPKRTVDQAIAKQLGLLPAQRPSG